MTRHIVVTGAAGGIGLETACRFATRGDFLTLVDGRESELLAASTKAQAAGASKAIVQTVDLRDTDAAEQTIEKAWTQAPVDLLVNAAGIYPATPFLELNARDWDKVQDLNVRAPLLLTVALANQARNAGRETAIINISSGAAQRARPGAAPYSTSKAALEMLTRSAALELGQFGIRVNAVSPGFVTVDSPVNPVTSEYATAVSGNPLGRKGQPEDIANAVEWLASQHANWITGEILRVDGGASTGALDLPLHWNKATYEPDSEKDN